MVTPYEAAAIFRIWERADIGSDGLHWKVAGTPRHDTRDMRLYAICSDVFYWGTADLEEITREDVALLERCAADLAGPEQAYLPELFAARKRGMRPMRSFCKDMDDEATVALFDACGPERTRESEG